MLSVLVLRARRRSLGYTLEPMECSEGRGGGGGKPRDGVRAGLLGRVLR
jgi:hypothetical protein